MNYLYTVRYYAGPYSGVRTVHAEDREQAIAIVRAKIRREMSMPMYADGYEIEGVQRPDYGNDRS